MNHHWGIIGSAICIIGGAVVAAVSDLGFNLKAYIFIAINDFASALNSILIKLKLEEAEINKTSIVFYNFLLTIVPLSFYVLFVEHPVEVLTFDGWNKPFFVIVFLVTSPCAFMLHLTK